MENDNKYKFTWEINNIENISIMTEGKTMEEFMKSFIDDNECCPNGCEWCDETINLPEV